MTRKQRRVRRVRARRLVAIATMLAALGTGVAVAAPAGAYNRTYPQSSAGCSHTNWDAYYAGNGGGVVSANRTQNSQFWWCD